MSIWHYDQFGRVTNKLDQVGTEILRYQYDAGDRLTNRLVQLRGIWPVPGGHIGSHIV